MDFLSQLHPKVVHFPIALLCCYVFLEVLTAIFKKDFLIKATLLFLLFGVLGALVAIFTGQQAEEAFDYWNKHASALFDQHEMYANITIWYFSALLVIRTFLVFKKKFTNVFKYIFAVLAIVGFYFVYQTGDRGGKMVFEEGIGTQYKVRVMEDN